MDSTRDEVVHAIVTHCHHEVVRDTLLAVLERPGFVLNPHSWCRAGELVLGAHEAVGGSDSLTAKRAAAGMELVMAGCHLFDHVADHEVDIAQTTEAEELALALALLDCGFAAIFDAAASRSSTIPLTQLLPVFTSFASACAGQFLDARLQMERSANTSQALEVATLKGGHLGRMAAYLGTAIETNDDTLISLCSEFGTNLFTAAQIIDDVMDACPPQRTGDLEENKKTLPVVFFTADASSPSLTPIQPEATRELFLASGARLFALMAAQVCLEKAKDTLSILQADNHKIDRLSELLRSVEQTALSVNVSN